MSKDLQSRATIFGPDSARAGDESKPNQPKDFSYPKRNFSKNGKDERSFLPSWYEAWKWLHYNEVDDTVYCIICLNAKRFHMLSDVKVEEAFVKKGYYNWKNAGSTDKGFNIHESSRCHQQAVHRLLTVPKSTQDISLALEKNLSNVQRQNRESLLKVISSVRYLARQGLLLRRKKDDKESNFQQLLKLRAENDPVFTEWLKRKNNKYTSPEIQNEILKELALTILRDVVESIKAADFFSIVLDESGDVSNKEQAVFCVRWIDENLTSYEDFAGLYEMEKTDADSIVRIIKDSLLGFGFDKEKLRGQCYDGCSMMMGKKTSVSKQIKDDVQPLALPTHCYAHSLNLACGDWMKNSSVVSKSLATSYDITTLIKFSPKRDSHLRKIHQEEIL